MTRRVPGRRRTYTDSTLRFPDLRIMDWVDTATVVPAPSPFTYTYRFNLHDRNDRYITQPIQATGNERIVVESVESTSGTINVRRNPLVDDYSTMTVESMFITYLLGKANTANACLTCIHKDKLCTAGYYVCATVYRMFEYYKTGQYPTEPVVEDVDDGIIRRIDVDE